MRQDGVRRWWPLVAAVMLGALVSLVASFLVSDTRRAEGSVLVSSPAGTGAVKPMLPNLRELATSGVVAGNVRGTLRLAESAAELRRHLRASVRSDSEVIAISATDHNADHARQIAQEAAVVFAQLVETRFGSTKPELHAAVIDSAHVLSGVDRHLLRNALIGACVGVLLGSALMFILAARVLPVPAAPAPAPGIESQDAGGATLDRRELLLEQRVKNVAARERALAARAGKLAVRERDLATRAAASPAPDSPPPHIAPAPAEDPQVGSSAVPTNEPAPASSTSSETEAVSTRQPPQPRPEPRQEFPGEPAAVTRVSHWNLNDLERAVATRVDIAPEDAEEARRYLFFLRGHAAPDGSLPRNFDGLLEEVFGMILDS
jgi:capsular polysaccharide biosynthesis protein